MNFTFFHRPKARQYNYKPQFYVPEEEKPVNYKNFDTDQFGDKLRDRWDKKRQHKSNATTNIRVIVWMVFLVLVLGIIGWKFLF